MKFNPQPKPQPRVRNSQAGLRQLEEARLCPCCGEPFRAWPGKSRHHVLPKGQRGDDVDENIVILDGDGTRGCHGILTSHPRGWEETAAALRMHLESSRPDVLAYLQRKLGAGYDAWVARHLPKRANLPGR